MHIVIDRKNDRATVFIRYKPCKHKVVVPVLIEEDWRENLLKQYETEQCVFCLFILDDEGEWRCFHENRTIKYCCEGTDCGCGGGHSVTCHNPRCQGVTYDEAERILISDGFRANSA